MLFPSARRGSLTVDAIIDLEGKSWSNTAIQQVHIIDLSEPVRPCRIYHASFIVVLAVDKETYELGAFESLFY